MNGRSTRHLFVVTDIEGVAGVSDWSQTRVAGPALDAARALATDEINAFVSGIHRGADLAGQRPPAITIWDGHGYGGTDFERIDPRVAKFRYDDRRGFSGLLELARSANPPADALAFVGQHAMEGSGGNLAHTYSSRRVRKYLLNGREIGEFGTRALHAWALGLPTLFISGDDVACAEARALIPGVLCASVKRSLAVTAASALGHEAACAMLGDEAAKIATFELASPTLTPTFVPSPPFEYRKVRKWRFGVVPRPDVVLRGDDLVDVLGRV